MNRVRQMCPRDSLPNSAEVEMTLPFDNPAMALIERSLPMSQSTVAKRAWLRDHRRVAIIALGAVFTLVLLLLFALRT